MSNITITDKGKYYESSCGATSKTGTQWREPNGNLIIDDARLYLAFHQQILDGQTAEPEPEVFTGDPKEWGRGLYTSPNEDGFYVVAVDLMGRWFYLKGDGEHGGVVMDINCLPSRSFTRYSTNPADIISDKVKGVKA